MLNFHSHQTFTVYYEYRTFFAAAINTAKTKRKCFKDWIQVQQYTATNFQGWSKITLKIKTTYFSIFRSGFQKILCDTDC